jgi:Flp pilus assembly protein TadD
MTMARFHVVAIGAALLLAVSGPSFAAKRTSDTKSAAKSQSRAAESSGSANTGSAIRPYSRDNPYAPGVNWPGKW